MLNENGEKLKQYEAKITEQDEMLNRSWLENEVKFVLKNEN